MKNWTDVYKFPLKLDKCGMQYVFDSNNQIVLNFVSEDDTLNKELFANIVGDSNDEPDEPFIYRPHDQMILNNGVILISIRGYGYLTGTGGLNLSGEEADKIQDEFGQYIVDKLNGKI